METIILKCDCGREHSVVRTKEIDLGVEYIKANYCPECVPTGYYEEKHVYYNAIRDEDLEAKYFRSNLGLNCGYNSIRLTHIPTGKSVDYSQNSVPQAYLRMKAKELLNVIVANYIKT